MKTTTALAIALFAAAISACGGNGPDTDRSSPALLGDDSSADTVATQLASSTRQLVEAIATGDSVALGRLLAPTTKAMDVRPSNLESSGGEPSEFGYFEIMAGNLAERIGPQYDTYHALPKGSSATVYAIGNTDGLLTRWAYDGTQWTAFNIVILGAESALRNLEMEPT